MWIPRASPSPPCLVSIPSRRQVAHRVRHLALPLPDQGRPVRPRAAVRARAAAASLLWHLVPRPHSGGRLRPAPLPPPPSQLPPLSPPVPRSFSLYEPVEFVRHFLLDKLEFKKVGGRAACGGVGVCVWLSRASSGQPPVGRARAAGPCLLRPPPPAWCQVRDSIAVHVPCSSKKMGIEESFMKVRRTPVWLCAGALCYVVLCLSVG